MRLILSIRMDDLYKREAITEAILQSINSEFQTQKSQLKVSWLLKF